MTKKLRILRKSAAAMLVCGTLLLQSAPAWSALPTAADSMTALSDSLGSDLASLLADENSLPAGDSVSDWIAFLEGRTGNGEQAIAYLNRLEEYVTDRYKTDGKLDPVTATSWHRAILTVIALGADPAAFATDADGKAINLVADGCYYYQNENASFDQQGLNAWLYALLALDSYCFKVPEDATTTREAILERLVAAQEEDGGFGLVKGGSDVDITAMVLQALAPYRNNTVQYLDRETYQVTISTVIEKALSYLSSQQQENGAYLCYDTENSESCSQVIIALCSLGIDPETDSRFVKAGGSVTDALERFLLDDMTYSHELEGASDVMATQQAAFAEFSLEQMRNRQRRIFDLRSEDLDAAMSLEYQIQEMSDEEILSKAESLREEYENVPAEDRSYVQSFGRVAEALCEKQISFDEETSKYYELNENVPVTANIQQSSTTKTSPVVFVGIGAALLAAAGIGGSVAVKKGKTKEKKKVKW